MSDYYSLDRLADVVGDKAAVDLLQARGGTRIYVPARLTDDHWLVGVMGRSAAELLVREISTNNNGGYIELPTGAGGAFAEYRRRLADAVAAGKTESEIARELRVHARTVRRMRARLKKQDDRQGTLL